MKTTRFIRGGAFLLALLLALLAVPFAAVSAEPDKGTPDADIAGAAQLDLHVYATSATSNSGFEHWGGHFQFDLNTNVSSLDATAGAGTSSSKWSFDLYYRPTSQSSGDYDKVTCDLKTSNCFYKFDNGDVIYRLILDNQIKSGKFVRLQKTTYNLVVVVKNDGAVEGYAELAFEWTEGADAAFSSFTGVYPDEATIGFVLPLYSEALTIHVAEGEVPTCPYSTFYPGKTFVGWEAEGVIYKDALPAATEDATYTAVYETAQPAGDVSGDGAVSAKDLSFLLQGLGGVAGVEIPAIASSLDGEEGFSIGDIAALVSQMQTGEFTSSDETIAALRGKRALFLGDSITAASTYDTYHKSWGWPRRIQRAYELSGAMNAGVDGASISTVRGANRVLAQLERNKSGRFDYVVLHGSTNDAWDSAPVGVMTAEDCFDVAQFDTSTFAGGLEELFARTKEYYPNAKIGYIINFRFHAGTPGRMGDMTEYVEVGKQICDKWGIPYLDLYNNEEVTNTLQSGVSAFCFGDSGIHPNSMGYDVLYPYIAEFMAGL